MKRIVLASFLVLAACSSPAEPRTTVSAGNEAPVEPPPTERAALDDEPVTPLTSREASVEEVRAMAAALGCPADAITDAGCSRCFALDEALRPTEPELDEGAPDLDIVLGRFAPDAERGAMVTVYGCSTRAAGDHQVYVLADEGGSWRPIAAWSYNDNASCVYPRRADGREHIVCAVSSGSQGCYDTEIGSPRALPLEGPLGIPATDDCMDRRIELGEVRDVDGDGDEDVAFTLNGEAHRLRQQEQGFATESTATR